MKTLVTGGSGFIGAALVRELAAAGHEVRVLDDSSRGRTSRLADLEDRLEFIAGDVRDFEAVRRATEGCDMVWHLAYVNGTRYFYEAPDLVLEVGVKGALNTLEAALDAGVSRYVLASSSEVYNAPTHLPTSESERLMIPDVTNPRFSYGGGKITSELLTLHLGGRRGLETVIFRPHNIYGPDMGFEHVIPELVSKMIDLSDGLRRRNIDLPIQGNGSETRAFCFIEDAARGAFLAGTKGNSGEIYHLGTEDEVSIRELIRGIAEVLDLEITIVSGELLSGSTPRRCPDIRKLGALGYSPTIDLKAGLERTVSWYRDHYLQLRSVAGEAPVTRG